jgi:hypothetical protein
MTIENTPTDYGALRTPTEADRAAGKAAARAAESHPASHRPAEVVAVHPATGELVNLTAADPADLAIGLEGASDLLDDLYAFRQAIVDELARRADARGRRTVTLGPIDVEVNAPTVDDYSVERLEAELEPLVDAGILDRELVDELIVQPPRPPAPPAKVDKRRVNALLKSDDRRILGALAAARTRRTQKRTAKITRLAVESTATEVDQ